MLALADDAALARLVIAATAIPAARVRGGQRRHAARQRAELLRHLTDTSRQACDVSFGGQTEKRLLPLSLTASDPKRSFGSIHSTCLPALVADRAMEAWYHSFIA